MADPIGQGTPTQNDALALIRQNLTNLGLPASLAEFAWTAIQQGTPASQVLLDLQEQPEFKKRFPAIGALRERAARGENVHVPTPGEYLDYEKTTTSLFRNAGLPVGFYDSPDDFTNLIAGQVSPEELRTRVNDGYARVANAPDDVKQTLFDYYGATPGGLAAFFLDPGRGGELLAKEANAALVGTAARRSGYGGISAGQAETLVGGGVSAGQAEERFGRLSQEKELFAPLPGEQGQTVSVGDQLATVLAPSGEVAQGLERTARRRKAAFAGGGEFASGQGGVTGLGRSE